MKKILLPLLLFYTGFLSAQNQSPVLFFSAGQVNNSIRLDFTIRAGNMCNGIIIYRSQDGDSFTEIGDIQGVCGSEDRNETYSFTDYNPIRNATGYYKLELGGFGFSDVISLLFIEIIPGQALIFPNPIVQSGKLLFENSAHQEHDLFIFNRQGKLLYEEATKNDFFLIQDNKLPPGIYFFHISFEGTPKYQGKFAVH